MLEFNFQPFPTLHSNRLILREPTMNDLDDFYQLRTNEKGMKYLDRKVETYEEVETKLKKIISDIKNSNNILWILSSPDNSKLMGTTGFWNMDKINHRIEIGYALLPEYWGKGIMTEANQTIIKYAFEKMKVHSIKANIHPGNNASRKVLEKIGFRQEAYFTEDYHYDGKFTDSAILSLLERWFVSQ